MAEGAIIFLLKVVYFSIERWCTFGLTNTKAKNPNKKDTGLFFFRGNKGARTAIVNAGGGFAFVGAMQDSFPHALVLSQKGYNAFALIYRPEARTACEDLARAIA